MQSSKSPYTIRPHSSKSRRSENSYDTKKSASKVIITPADRRAVLRKLMIQNRKGNEDFLQDLEQNSTASISIDLTDDEQETSLVASSNDTKEGNKSVPSRLTPEAISQYSFLFNRDLSNLSSPKSEPGKQIERKEFLASRLATYRKNQTKGSSLVDTRIASADNILKLSDDPSIMLLASIKQKSPPNRPKSAPPGDRKRVMMHTRNDFMVHLSRSVFGCIDGTDYTNTDQDEYGDESKENNFSPDYREAIYEGPIQEIDFESHRSDLSSISGFQLW